MKKTAAILLAVCILFAFAACGGKGDAQGEKTLTGAWHLCDEGETTPKVIVVFNEDKTGTYTGIANGIDTVRAFTYTDDGTKIHIDYNEGEPSSADWNYTLEVDRLTVNEKLVFTRPVTQ